MSRPVPAPAARATAVRSAPATVPAKVALKAPVKAPAKAPPKARAVATADILTDLPVSAPVGRRVAFRPSDVALSLMALLFAAAAVMTYFAGTPVGARAARVATPTQVLPTDWASRVEAQRARQKRELTSNAAYMARMASLDRDLLAGRAPPPELAPGQDLKGARVAP